MEIVNPNISRGNIRHALFDFDGTLSLIREGWREVMIPLMVELLLQTPRHESETELRAVVAEFVDRLTGRQTIYQMIQLCEEINRRGGHAADPLVYKKMYLARLWAHIEHRVKALQAGTIAPEELMVPGAVAMLDALRARGVTCYLASGTDEPDVRAEARALGITPYFAGIYGAQDDYKNFSKKMVIDRILRDHNLHGSEFVAFGDGFVEIEDAKAVGGIAVGVASNEDTRTGINAWKRTRLLQAGADIIIPDFREHAALIAYLFGDSPQLPARSLESSGWTEPGGTRRNFARSSMPYPIFDRSRLHIKPLAERVHDMTLTDVLPLDAVIPAFDNPQLPQIAERIARARQRERPVILMMGAHVIKSGLSRYVIDWMERGIVTHVAMNGAGPIHDFELALIGATTESVARYIQEGQFGLWRETARLNDALAAGARDGLGYGEAIGRMIEEDKFPHRDVSILAAGYRLRVPVTVHVGIGYDITHEQPNADGAVIGAASYRDFLVFAQAITQLQGGVMLNFGTAVMGPEVYLKALSMARNVACQEGKRINEFTTAVFDLQDLGEDVHHEAPKEDAAYYFRPFKTILVRTVADGGESFYVRGHHRATLPNLHRLVNRGMNAEG